MGLSRETVEKVSLLARLQFPPAELDALTEQLQRIIGYVEQLDDVDTTDVAPMAHAIELSNVFADDAPQPSLPREQALANAPKRDDECFRVPAVLGE